MQAAQVPVEAQRRLVLRVRERRERGEAACRDEAEGGAKHRADPQVSVARPRD